VVVDLQATANHFAPGHRIRLDVSSSNYPQLDVNPNTGGPLWGDLPARVARQDVWSDPEHPSYVELFTVGAARCR
jgi:predicted acyl esterase